jgi:hypothetical protein
MGPNHNQERIRVSAQLCGFGSDLDSLNRKQMKQKFENIILCGRCYTVMPVLPTSTVPVKEKIPNFFFF